jgi:hypothetical protein
MGLEPLEHPLYRILRFRFQECPFRVDRVRTQRGVLPGSEVIEPQPSESVSPSQRVQADVGGDPAEPTTDVQIIGGLRKCAIRLDEAFLGQVTRFFGISDHTIDELIDRTFVLLIQQRESIVVTSLGAGDAPQFVCR